MASILLCEGSGVPDPVRVSFRSRTSPPARGVRQWLGDIILFTFLSGSCCLFLIHC